MSATAPFSRRVAMGLAIAAVLSFVLGVVFAMLGPEVREQDSAGADTFSRSAVGHRGLLEAMQRMGVPLLVSRFATGERAGEGTALLLLEPRVSSSDPTARDLGELVAASKAEVVVVVLPKWRVERYGAEAGWVARVRPHDTPRSSEVLEALDIEAQVGAGHGPWTLDPELSAPAPSIPHHRQVVHGPDLHPIVSDARGALVARTQRAGRRVVVIADPDVLNNAGLVEGENAAFTFALLAHLSGDRTLVLDETLHGFAAPEGVWSRLFRFPLVLATLQVVVVLVLMVLAGVRRFGAARPLEASLGRGRVVLVENTATLLWYGGHSHDALGRYWRATLDELRRHLHAPPRLDEPGLLAWLRRVGSGRGVTESPQALAEAVDAAVARRADGERLLRVARRVHRWRLTLLQFERTP